MTQKTTPPSPVATDGLTKEYRTGRRRVIALNDVSMTVRSGEFVTVMGASGSGKSTLLHLIAGLTEPTSGSVKINDVDLAGLSDSARTRFRLENIGVVFQAFNLIPTLTAEENILLPSLIEGRKRMSVTKLDEMLDLLELRERRTHRPDSLSGGEQQRVAIGRALSMNPALILADEPTGNLDFPSAQEFCGLLSTLNKTTGCAILLVSHDPVIAAHAERIHILKDGCMVDSFDSAHNPDTVSKRYLAAMSAKTANA